MLLRPRSIHIFLADGDPNGVRIAQLSMSTIQAIAFRREVFRDIKNSFPELDKAGAYILIGSDEEKPGRQIAYIGESENLNKRLDYHFTNKNPSDAKPFWRETIVLLSKDENLTKSHARYVEACLIRSAARTLGWDMPNSKTPSENAGRLPRADVAAMDEFVEQSKLLVAALGYNLFRETIGENAGHASSSSSIKLSDEPNEGSVFEFKGDGYDARLLVTQSGEFVIKAGSRARRSDAPSIPAGAALLRAELSQRNILQDDGQALVLNGDVAVSSLSAAAALIYGMSVNGRTAWKTPDGRTYAEVEAAAAAKPVAATAESAAGK